MPPASPSSPAASACRARSSSSATATGTPVLSGAVLSGAAPGARLERPLKATLDRIGVERAGAEGKAKALIFDASGISDSTELVELQRFFYPGVGRLQRNGRVVVLGVPPAEAGSTRAATAQRALEGFTRSLGKEVGGRGATAQLVLVSAGGEDQLESTLRFLLSPQIRLRLRAGDTRSGRASRPSPTSTGSGRWPARGRSSPAPRAGSAPRSPGPWPATARASSASTSRRPPRSSAPSPPRSTATRSSSTSPPPRRRSGSPSASPTASTSSSTTPASPRTGRSPRCPRSAGRR